MYCIVMCVVVFVNGFSSTIKLQLLKRTSHITMLTNQRRLVSTSINIHKLLHGKKYSVELNSSLEQDQSQQQKKVHSPRSNERRCKCDVMQAQLDFYCLNWCLYIFGILNWLCRG